MIRERARQFIRLNTNILYGVLPLLMLLSTAYSQVIIPEPKADCSEGMNAENALFCEQEKLETVLSNIDDTYQAILMLLDQSIRFYDSKYQDAYYDNYEMPYLAVKEKIVKSQVLWEQFAKDDCAVIYQMASRGTAKNDLELQCLQDFSRDRLQTLRDYLEEIELDTRTLLELESRT